VPKCEYKSTLPQKSVPASPLIEDLTRRSRFTFDGSFNIHLFIGDIDYAQPERFLTKKNEVGYAGIFASRPANPCANCGQQRGDGIVYQDAIPITTQLGRYLTSYTDPDGPDAQMRTLESFESEHVVPFLRKHLRWILTGAASNLLNDAQKIKDSRLEISVWDRIFDLPTAEHLLGVYHLADLHLEVTETRLGGYGYTGA